ncbi:hypothetical protein LSH36_180g04014 [Paralvinella palmiformis]|uniref:C2 domain-containing protein n=1 Tax=Paralvinella palmiformis TaxID=53620 RepID=A0AAD9JS66_9ANNE|nr:hypothetical protein LSH36_180g04014 [Paralvinella palmiformis]
MGVEREFDIGREAAPLAVHWYVVCGIVVASAAFLVGVSACAYRWYQHRGARDVNNRLSSAIKKGIRESGSGLRKSPSLRSTNSAKSTSSGRSARSGGGGGALAQQGPDQQYQGAAGSVGGQQLARSPSRSLDPSQMKAEYSVENEENRAPLMRKSPTEKGDTMKEKAEDELKANKLGSLQFAVEYDHQKTALVVTIIRAAELPAKDPNIGSSDPYVKLQLLPDKRHKVKTRVLRKTLNPVYDEIFTFYGIDFNQLQAVTLHFVVLSFDRFSRDDIIGEVIYPLAGLELAEKEPVTMMKPISPRHIKVSQSVRQMVHYSLIVGYL